ncbi:MAG: aminotransferase class V-fold PLP-dependent enzyme [Neisseriaceae bacterium]
MEDQYFLERELDETSLDQTIKNFYQQKDAAGPSMKGEVQSFFSSSIVQQGVNSEEYIHVLAHKVLPYVSHIASPTFIGHMTSRLPTFMTQMARLVVALNQNVLKVETSNALTFQEKEVIAQVHRLIYLFEDEFYKVHIQNPATSLGFFTSGGTLSNLTAIYAALNNSIECEGNRLKYWLAHGYSDVVMIGSKLLHYSFGKIALLLGVTLLKCPVTSEYQIDLEKLAELLEQCQRESKKVIALIGIAGSTDFGSIDDLAGMARLADKYGVHFHVDGAWGGAFILSSAHRYLLSGIEKADTVSLDGHKQLMLPMGSGMLFFKDPFLARVNLQHAPYAVRRDSADLGRFTIEGSRAANGLYLDAALKILGLKGYERILEHSLSNTRYMANQVDEGECFELLSRPPLNLLLYRYLPAAYRSRVIEPSEQTFLNQVNVHLQEEQKRRGTSFVSRTMCQLHQYPEGEIVCLRAVLFNPLTQLQDIDTVLSEQIQIAQELGYA